MAGRGRRLAGVEGNDWRKCLILHQGLREEDNDSSRGDGRMWNEVNLSRENIADGEAEAGKHIATVEGITIRKG